MSCDADNITKTTTVKWGKKIGDITLTGPCREHHPKPHCVLEKVGFVGIYDIFFRIFAQNIDCRSFLEQPHRGGSNKHPQFTFER